MVQIGLNIIWAYGSISSFQLNKLYKPFGAIDVNMKNSSSGIQKGHAFVKFKSQEEAYIAQQKTNGTNIGDITITVEVQEYQTILVKRSLTNDKQNLTSNRKLSTANSQLNTESKQTVISSTQRKSKGFIPKQIGYTSKSYLQQSSSMNLFDETPQYEDFEIVKKLFGGAMGKTFVVRHKPSGLLYVMKRVDYLDEKDKKMADDEIAQMKLLSSKYTVRLIWTFIKKPDMHVITEYCSRGDLRKLMKELQTLPEAERIERVWEIFAQIVLALSFMHSRKVIHRDIKPENIFIMKDGSARLGDFGLSKIINENDYYAKAAGTKFYFAPEVFMQQKMYYETDIYALGIVIFECLTGIHPFLAQNEEETINNIKNGIFAQLPNWVPTEMKKTIMKMISVV
ncbi:MAG: putative serine/threonine-protein kinase Nek6 [Streblomastix strix]|uniref:non-specific serine/threonine protein kinase n=1 Tax=Streblomastix strix TaxID=222440 RepID=A0A5J4UKR1_9EUKA|nr:MAG: putative serine/threonine-protein kinase Nek6 [Streblomastix strix]